MQHDCPGDQGTGRLIAVLRLVEHQYVTFDYEEDVVVDGWTGHRA